MTRIEDNYGVCPACGDPMRALDGMDAGGIPSTWNSTCSPECGNYIAGIVEAAPDSPKAVAWQAMKDRLDADRDALDKAQAECEHDWQPEPERFTHRIITLSTFTDGKFTHTRHKALECTKCHATKAGEEIANAYPV